MEIITFAIISIILLIIILRVDSQNKARFASLKGRISNVDDHLDDLEDNNKESFDWYLSLMGYKRIDLNHKEGLVLAEDIEGNIFIAERFTSPLVFVPVKEKKIKNGTRQVEYAGKMLEFESQSAKEF